METEALNTLSGYAYIGAGLAIGLAGLGAGIGLGLATKGFMEGAARQPELIENLQKKFILGAALAEACGIYGLLIALVLAFK